MRFTLWLGHIRAVDSIIFDLVARRIIGHGHYERVGCCIGIGSNELSTDNLHRPGGMSLS
jgi:hypothetical protein